MAYPAPFTDQQIADQITLSGKHWNKTTITYSFNNFSTAGNALDASQIAWIDGAIAIFEELYNLDFVLAAGTGEITFNGSSGNGTYASTTWYPSGQVIVSSNIYFDQSWASNQPVNLDSYGFTTVMHEFQHALGMSHPGPYNATDVPKPTYMADAVFLQDTTRYSIMSYFDPAEDGSGSAYYDFTNNKFVTPVTPMIYDILAMTSGAYNGLFGGYSFNTTTRATDTTYGYNATPGIRWVYDFTVLTAPVVTIYDAGGIDTLDMSGDTVARKIVVNYNPDGTVASYNPWATRTASVIDLHEGSYSSTNGMTNNIGIAFGTIIENAIGTRFNDTIYGNTVANQLWGGSGNDWIHGGQGNDTIYGNQGNDELRGGAGNDWIHGGQGDDTIYGNPGADTLSGGLGNDWVHGGQGDDTIYGNLGNDTLSGGLGNDWVHGGQGNDTIYGNLGTDTLSGGLGDDWVHGGQDNDTIYGNPGADTLHGGTGNDWIHGGQGDDTIWGDAGSDTINGGVGFDIARFSGLIAEYDIVNNSGGSWSVTNIATGDVDTLIGIEQLQYDDGYII